MIADVEVCIILLVLVLLTKSGEAVVDVLVKVVVAKVDFVVVRLVLVVIVDVVF